MRSTCSSSISATRPSSGTAFIKPRNKRHHNETNDSLGREWIMAAQAIDLHEELAEAKVGKFHWRLGAIMGLLTLFDGYDTFNPAYVIHYVAKPWGLQAGQAGLLISSGLVGFLLGAAIHGI